MSELRITYQIQLGEGQAIAYEIGEDSAIARSDLDELLDRIGSAAERRKAVFDLPFHQARLMSNLELLEKQKRALAEAEARQQANVVVMSRNRNREAAPAPGDVNAVLQHQNAVMQTENTIRSDEIRIPYLQAVIAGEPPPDLFPEVKRHLMAAE